MWFVDRIGQPRGIPEVSLACLSSVFQKDSVGQLFPLASQENLKELKPPEFFRK